MNKKERLKLFWDIVRLINRKHCEGNLNITNISIGRLRSHCGTYYQRGRYYLAKGSFAAGKYNSRMKKIKLKERKSIFTQMPILVHELVHAYQYQFLDYEKKKKRYSSRKQWERFIHNRTFDRYFDAFSKTVVDNIYLKVR